MIAPKLLGHFELQVLSAVQALGEGEAYGAAVREWLYDEFRLMASPGAVYVTFGRLARKGMVRPIDMPPEPRRGGRRRIAYTVTEAGEAAMAATREALARALG